MEQAVDDRNECAPAKPEETTNEWNSADQQICRLKGSERPTLSMLRANAIRSDWSEMQENGKSLRTNRFVGRRRQTVAQWSVNYGPAFASQCTMIGRNGQRFWAQLEGEESSKV